MSNKESYGIIGNQCFGSACGAGWLTVLPESRPWWWWLGGGQTGTAGYYRVNVCITILSKIYFYFTAGNCRYYAEKARGAALKIENGVNCCWEKGIIV